MAALITVAAVAGNDSGVRAAQTDPGAEDYPTLEGRFADEGVLVPLVALEAFSADGEFYISYKSIDGIIYAGGNWSNRIDLAIERADTDDTYSGPYIFPLEYRQQERWAQLPDERVVPELLGIEQWVRFREQLFASVVPRAEKAGVVLNFDNDDYFLYYNDTGRFEVRLITDKPADYSVRESINLADFIQRARPILESFLAEEGITNRRVVFSTGDIGAYSLPFLYVNRDLPLAAFARYAPLRRDRSAAAGTQLAQSVGHVAQSHLGGLFVRPVSSVFRLFFTVTDAAVETVRPTWLVTLEAAPIPELSGGQGMDLAAWEKRLDEITGRPTSKAEIDFLIDGEEYFTRFTDAITSARDSVLIRTYIFDNDDFAEKIGRSLKRRANEGLDVKILLDGLGTILATGTQHESMPEDYAPPASVRLFLESDSDIDVRQVKNPWLSAGDHVKTTIIDSEIAFTGGMNIGREYRYVWHDLMMEARGPIVDILRREFYDAWAHAGAMGDVGYLFHKMKPNRHVAADVGYPTRVLFTRAGNAEIFRAQREAIQSAQHYIYIENAYFSDDTMLYELARARRRGVDVRIILPLVSNHGPMNQSNVLAANAMMEHGIRVFLYPGMSHVKAAVFDGWACLGSANWDRLSFRTNKELNLATSHPEAVDELLERIFARDFAESVELTEPFPARWSDHLMEIAADFLL